MGHGMWHHQGKPSKHTSCFYCSWRSKCREIRDQCYKMFFLSNSQIFKPARVFVPGKALQPTCFAGKAKTYPREALGQGPGLAHKHNIRLESLMTFIPGFRLIKLLSFTTDDAAKNKPGLRQACFVGIFHLVNCFFVTKNELLILCFLYFIAFKLATFLNSKNSTSELIFSPQVVFQLLIIL